MTTVHDDRLGEVADRLRAIVLLARGGLDITSAEKLAAIDSLACWAGLHLAVHREHSEPEIPSHRDGGLLLDRWDAA